VPRTAPSCTCRALIASSCDRGEGSPSPRRVSFRVMCHGLMIHDRHGDGSAAPRPCQRMRADAVPRRNGGRTIPCPALRRRRCRLRGEHRPALGGPHGRHRPRSSRPANTPEGRRRWCACRDASGVRFHHRTCACLTDLQHDTSTSLELIRGHSTPVYLVKNMVVGH
jgi:hypothetical protein